MRKYKLTCGGKLGESCASFSCTVKTGRITVVLFSCLDFCADLATVELLLLTKLFADNTRLTDPVLVRLLLVVTCNKQICRYLIKIIPKYLLLHML